MREKKVLFGYKPRKVKQYVSVLNTEIMLIEEKRKLMGDFFMKEQTELLQQIDQLTEEMVMIESMELSLKQWIGRNQA